MNPGCSRTKQIGQDSVGEERREEITMRRGKKHSARERPPTLIGNPLR